MRRPLALLLLCAVPLLAEDPPAQPERRTVTVAGPGAEHLAQTFAELRGVKGVPEGWDSPASVAKDPFFSALSQLEGFKSGERSAVVEGGEFKGILITHEGKSFLYKPPQPFAAQVPKDGEVAQTVLGLQGGRAVERKIDTLSPTEQAAARGNVSGVGRLVLGSADRAFDGSALRGDGVFLGGKRVADKRAPPAAGAPFKAVERPKGDKLPIVNEYKGAPPADLKPGQFFWDGKTLMAAEAAVDGGGMRARAVGYMADMKKDPSGDMVFWHGGAVPDPKGTHPAARENWSLLYVPKLEKHMEAVEGNNTAHHVAQYAMMDLSRGKVLKTPDGPRLDLASALQDHPTVWRLPPADEKLRNSLDKPETKPLFRFGAPVATKDRSYQSFIDMRGNTYQEQERNGQKFIVKTGRLFNLKEPPSPSDRVPGTERTVPILVAPVERPEAPPDPFAEYDKALAGKLPSYLERAAKTLDYDGFSAEAAQRYAKDRRELEISAANGKADPLTPRPFPGGFGSANAGLDAVRRLAALKLTDSGDIVRRTRLLQGALSNPEPEVRQAAAEALAASGEYGRDARHALAATAVLDLNPLVRSAAALALPKVDPTNAAAYRVLPEFPKTQPAPPKPVYGPQPEPRPVPSRESDLAAALRLPADSPDRNTAVQAQVSRFLRSDQNSLEAEKARNELAVLLTHTSPLTRAQAAGALLMADRKRPNADAVTTLSRFLGSDARAMDPALRAYCLSGLMELEKPTPGLLGGLQTAVENTTEPLPVRQQAFLALLKLQPDDKSRLSLMESYGKNPSTRMVLPRSAAEPPFDPFRRNSDPFGGLLRPR
ncbi:hypothetical protein EPO15_13415 [bacterium]|nr:MAG: hypothetical protein EPO15_13415 [bacterium]